MKKHLWKQFVPTAYTLEKRLLAVAIILKVCEYCFFLDRVKRTCGILRSA